MNNPLEMQNDEREVLLSIYDGDSAFNQLSNNTFQYKLGEHEHIKSFLLELQWGDKYPMEKPVINMDTFYNRNLTDEVKNKIINLVSNEAEQYIGEAMTYSLFECVKEKYEELIQDLPDSLISETVKDLEKIDISEKNIAKKVPKKEQLTKAQKRRHWDKVEARGEKPRGWDWMDIIKHLSQTGSKDNSISEGATTNSTVT